MKKILLAVAVIGLSMASCKKDYTCNCTVTTPGSTTSQTTPATFHAKKSDAKNACNDLQTTYTSSGSTASCALK